MAGQLLPLLVGEIFVDVTITPPGEENKLRLGGIVHAARSFWAQGVPFGVAAFVPEYLADSAREYLEKFGCTSYTILGKISGAPNIVLIFDAKEVDDQKYEFLLRDEKVVKQLPGLPAANFVGFTDALIFPGSYNLEDACRQLPPSLPIHIDVAYDLARVTDLKNIQQRIATIFISTSSQLFREIGSSGIDELATNFAPIKPDTILLKENRGGCRLRVVTGNLTEHIPAQLNTTVNSVGVGDAFNAAYVARLHSGPIEAAWRGTSAASAYAQTTEPDIFRKYVQRDAQLSFTELQSLGGTTLPWEERKKCHIYLAAPDFADSDRHALEQAASALQYHNFSVRRPIQENGEIPVGSDDAILVDTYRKDLELLRQCRMVFAVPTNRDPGTLVEIGLALAYGIPVVVYDPKHECRNTMVVGGTVRYSDDLDACLNATFECFSSQRVKT